MKWFRVRSASPVTFPFLRGHIQAFPNSVFVVSDDVFFPPPAFKHVFAELPANSPVIAALSDRAEEKLKNSNIAVFPPREFTGLPFVRPVPKRFSIPTPDPESAKAEAVTDDPLVEEPSVEEKPSMGEPSDEPALSVTYSAKELKKMKKSELIKLAEDMGLDVSELNTKNKLIEALTS